MDIKKKPASYAAELLIVVIGVFLGMLAAEWNANRQVKKQQHALLVGLKSELQSNYDVLSKLDKARKPFYRSMDSLQKVLTPENYAERFEARPFNERVPNWHGLQGINGGTAMFEAAKFSNLLQSFDIELLQKLSLTYGLIESNSEFRSLLLQQFFGIDENTSYDEAWTLMWRIREEYYGTQYILLEKLQDCMDLIGEEIE